jgi:hypothetical protein
MAGRTGTGTSIPVMSSSAGSRLVRRCLAAPGRQGARWPASTSSPTPASCAPSTVAAATWPGVTCCSRAGFSACDSTSASGSPALIDETRDTERAWGWSYQTLQGHLEQGRLSYEVIKDLATGRVVFRGSATRGWRRFRVPSCAWGSACSAARTQQRFYLAIQRRMRRLVEVALRGEPLPSPAVRTDGLGPGSVRDDAASPRAPRPFLAAPGTVSRTRSGDPSPSFLHMISITVPPPAG